MKRKWLLVAFAVLAAAALSLSVNAVSWWSAGEVAFGPFGAHHCFGGDCRGTGLAWIGGDDLWLRAAVATRVAGIVSMVVLLIVAGAVAAGRVPRLFARASLVSLATAIVCGLYFYLRFPGLPSATIGFGFPLYVVGVVLGAAASITVARAK